ncbi:hypothetical protein BM613_07290 [Sulfoacidibacillus thermotolerans]|uniref:Uncharacterized protein n=1 Tax=Sulfoacidibacillus thermotolerans TaxID=1765684 RepID=A0A2U3D920_SULT2|nr:hypothetical protein BM613_07290 [Sulfoacidibacillus thermotolerans]
MLDTREASTAENVSSKAEVVDGASAEGTGNVATVDSRKFTDYIFKDGVIYLKMELNMEKTRCLKAWGTTKAVRINWLRFIRNKLLRNSKLVIFLWVS